MWDAENVRWHFSEYVHTFLCLVINNLNTSIGVNTLLSGFEEVIYRRSCAGSSQATLSKHRHVAQEVSDKGRYQRVDTFPSPAVETRWPLWKPHVAHRTSYLPILS